MNETYFHFPKTAADELRQLLRDALEPRVPVSDNHRVTAMRVGQERIRLLEEAIALLNYHTQ